MNETVPELSPWMEIAAELRRIADDAEKLAGEPAPSCFQIHIQPRPHDKPEAIAAVDIIALALLGKPGKTVRMSDGVYHRNADGERGPISLSTYRKVPEPPTAEIERLRTRLAELEAQHDPTGLDYTRADDGTADPTPTGPRVAPHFESGTDERPVDETEAGTPPDVKCDGCQKCAPRTIEAHLAAGGTVENTPDGRLVFSGGLVDETEPTCPPECAQNWMRASDPLVHVGHCPKSRPGEIDPDSSMEAHYDAETEAMTGLGITEACVITGWAGLCTTHKARHIAIGEAKCGCPVYPYAGRGDAADTIVDHRQNCKATS